MLLILKIIILANASTRNLPLNFLRPRVLHFPDNLASSIFDYCTHMAASEHFAIASNHITIPIS